ncbi:hypothetical protein CKO37_09150 [Rubrivivax gelatinosus]|nr:hypothetical protein [Rubrivivax gelatinosus]
MLWLAAWGACAQDDWPALRDVDLQVRAGSALDFSALVREGPAGRDGWVRADAQGRLRFERVEEPQRFLCASMVFNPDNGGVPDKDEARALAAQLRRTGYNLVRLHYVDAHLMTRRTRDFDFDPEQFDRLQYLMSELKAAGIYWLVDGLTSNNAAYGDAPANRYQSRHHAKWDVLTGDAGFEHWATVVDRLWGVRNRYTGTVPLADPAMLGVILVNEGEADFMAAAERRARYPEALQPAFRTWLRERYGSDTGLRRAWGAQAGPAESLDAGIEMPADARGAGARARDFARFITELQQRAFRRMDEHVRERGFKGLTTGYDSWSFYGGDLTRQALATIDMHAYQGVPTRHGQAGSQLRQDSLFDNGARMVRSLAVARQWGKPMIVSEYGQPFWNRHRHEAAALVPAVAAHQGWSALCQFGETPIQPRYEASRFSRRSAIYPFGIGADPVARAGERLAALLYRRGDVSASAHRVRLRLDAEAVFERGLWRQQVPEALSSLALVAPIGLDFGSPARAAAGELTLPLAVGERAADDAGALRDPLGALRRAGVVAPDNASRPPSRVFESDTGELRFDAPARRIVVNTPRSAAVVLDGGSARAGALEVRDASAPALFAAASLDGQPIVRSRRLLLWAVTDALNTGMRFSDAQRTTLQAIGSFPPRVQPVAATLRLHGLAAAGLKAWPLGLDGQRRTALPLRGVDGGVELSIDTARLPEGPALFFEIAAE